MKQDASPQELNASTLGRTPIRGMDAIDDQTVMAFATPVINVRWSGMDAMNDALRMIILDAERRTEGVVRSNVGGWHSTTGFLELGTDVVAELRGRICDLVTEVRARVLPADQGSNAARFHLEGWANVLRTGQYNTMHCHPNAVWSGVYYVTDNPTAGTHPFSGKLELIDPRPGAALEYREASSLYGRFMLSPVAGQIVIFPSWLNHIVHPYFGESPRISVAFNVNPMG
ncbi:MAG: TIGR02466 family protein [Pseudomonadota bacterium]